MHWCLCAENEFTTHQARKSLRLCLAGLRIRCFDPIAKASELPDHSCRALLLRLLGDSWAPFFVTNSLVQDQPDQSTVSMGNGPDGLIMSQARDRAVIDKFEDASFGPGCGVGRLIENAPHVAVALRRAVAVVHSRAFVVAGAGAHPRGETFLGRKGRCGGADSAMICCAESTPRPGTSASR